MRINAELENEWMARLAIKTETEGLVRDNLGCACPQEVFEHYQVHRGKGGSVPLVRLIIGERLLVELVDVSRITDPEQTIPEFLRRGVEARDTLGLNRFRLVIAGPPPAAGIGGFRKYADGLGPNVHIHFVDGV